MDIDEEAFRAGTGLGAALWLPACARSSAVWCRDSRRAAARGEGDLTGIATDIAERMRDGALWIIGPGTTTRAIAERLGVNKTLLGVDLYSRGEVVALDATEQRFAAASRWNAGPDRGDADRRSGVPLRPGQSADQPGGDPAGRQGEYRRGGDIGEADRSGRRALAGRYRRRRARSPSLPATCAW